MLILTCSDTAQMCYNARKILVIVKTLIKVIQWSVPLLLVFLGTWDMFKAVTKADDQKYVQDATKKFIRRLIAGVVVFLVPFLVRLVLNFVDNNIFSSEDVSSTSWISCWENVDNSNSDYFSGCKNIYNRESSSDDSSDDSSSSDSGTDKQASVEVTKDSKTCYVFDLFNTCSVGTLKKQSDTYYNGASCRLELKGDYNLKAGNNTSLEKCISDCSTSFPKNEAAIITEEGVCTCISEAPRKENNGLGTIPSFTADGTYKIYSCNSDISCSDAASFCINTGVTGTTKSQ